MTFVLFSIGITVAFFISSLMLMNIGRQLGLKYLRQEGVSMAGLATIEGAIFALIGLLLAFTISGALQRFDERRQMVIQEANAVSIAYDRLRLFEGEVGRDVRNKLKDYVQARIELYRMPHDFSLWEGAEVWPREQQDKILELRNKTWNATIAACPEVNYRPACGLIVPALGNVFEAARLRLAVPEKHPPQIIYVVLFGLGLGSSLLAGFGMAAASARSWIHIISFAGALAITLYVVTDLEFPRLGLIRLENFDRFLVEAYEQMQ